MLFINARLTVADLPFGLIAFPRLYVGREHKDRFGGLGLSIVKQLCLACGGTVHAEMKNNILSIEVGFAFWCPGRRWNRGRPRELARR